MNLPENTGGEFMNGAVPALVNGREAATTDAVYDAELVDEPPKPVYYQPKLGRFTSWWLRSRRVPPG